MSGGHWGYLSYKIEERVGQPLDEVWRLLAAIEHELDWGICGDTCYDCAKIRTINALEAYFDGGATGAESALRVLHSSESECQKCKDWDKQRKQPREKRAYTPIPVEIVHDGKTFKWTLQLEVQS